MAVIQISRTHHLSHDAARESANQMAAHLADKFSVVYDWEGDTLRFRRSGVKGSLVVFADRIDVKVELGLLLRPLKTRIEQEIHDYMDGIS